MECSIESCSEPAGSKYCGYRCQQHYARWLAEMIANGQTRNGKNRCEVRGCYNKVKSQGRCRKHVAQFALSKSV